MTSVSQQKDTKCMSTQNMLVGHGMARVMCHVSLAGQQSATIIIQRQLKLAAFRRVPTDRSAWKWPKFESPPKHPFFKR